MKNPSLAAGALLLLLLCACSRQPEGPPPSFPEPAPSSHAGAADAPPSSVPAGTDKTARSGRFFLPEDARILPYGKSQCYQAYRTVPELYSQAHTVVLGTITEAGYWDGTGRGQTFYDFQVKTCYQGNLQPGDIISVLSPGGYLRMETLVGTFGAGLFPDCKEEDIPRTFLDQPFDGAPYPKTGETCLLFLGAPKEEAPYPIGAYSEDFFFMGRFRQEEDGLFRRYAPADQPDLYDDPETGLSPKLEFTLQELEAELNACQGNHSQP